MTISCRLSSPETVTCLTVPPQLWQAVAWQRLPDDLFPKNISFTCSSINYVAHCIDLLVVLATASDERRRQQLTLHRHGRPSSSRSGTGSASALPKNYFSTVLTPLAHHTPHTYPPSSSSRPQDPSPSLQLHRHCILPASSSLSPAQSLSHPPRF